MDNQENFSLNDRYIKTQGSVLLSGIQALVRLPIDQARLDQSRHLNTAGFISGYRGSPLGGLDKAFWQADSFLKQYAIHFSSGINEDLAATSVWGSQQVNLFPDANYEGVFSLWYGKGPGVDRSGDVFKHGNAAGVSKYGGVLAVVGDDHACKSSTLPHQSDFAFIDAMMPILYPANVQEILDYGIYGWALSRYAGLWVGFKILADIADSSMVVNVGCEQYSFHYPAFIGDSNVAIRWPDTPVAQERRLHRDRLAAAQHFIRSNHLDKVVVNSDNPSFGIIVAGKSWLDTRQALSDMGLNEATLSKMGIKVYKPAMIWPLEPEHLKIFAEKLRSILVIEEKRALVESQVKEILYASQVRPEVFGRFGPDEEMWLSSELDLSPDAIGVVLKKWLTYYRISSDFGDHLVTVTTSTQTSPELPKAKVYDPQVEGDVLLQRTPHFCSGCPHNTSTRLPEGSRAGGGIGCHYMATWMNRGTETFTQMGGEGVPWIGQSPFTKTKHIFQNLGDGTYYHSGLLAIRAAIAAGINITYKILYNDAVAMTGGQPVDGALSVATITRQLAAEGVKHQVIVTDNPAKQYTFMCRLKRRFLDKDPLAFGVKVYHRDHLIAVQEKLRAYSGVTVLIYDQVCAAEKRRRKKRSKIFTPEKKVFINSRVCEGCGDCNTESNCLSVLPLETVRGRKRTIDQGACNTDMSCINGFCPSFVTVTEKKKSRLMQWFNQLSGNGRLSDASSDKTIQKTELPAPECVVCEEPWNLVIAGVGGTGVVTVSALLAVAAHLEGKGVFTLDQTGLAQKFGAVTSHVRVALEQKNINAKIPYKGANLLLGMDILVSSSDKVLPYLSDIKTCAVVNNLQSMPAEFINNRDLSFPYESVVSLLIDHTREYDFYQIEATAISEEITGDTIVANLLLLGFACQKGWLPVHHDSLEKAIQVNGVAVNENLKAFLWGRRIAYDQSLNQSQATYNMSANTTVNDKAEGLPNIISNEIKWLTEYQGERLADQYRNMIARVELAEKRVSPCHQLTQLVAHNYSKVLAVKDEYEVARLFLKDNFLEHLKKQEAGGSVVHFYLSPPILARLIAKNGKQGKIKLGEWVWSLFKVLKRMKVCRGQWYDPFYYTEENKLHRTVQRHYELDLYAIITQLSVENYQHAVELARWPEEVRGFGHIKANAFKNLQSKRFDLTRKIRETSSMCWNDNSHTKQQSNEMLEV